MTPAQIAEALRADPLLDRGGLLKAGGRRMIREALSTLRSRGLRAYVLVVARGAPLSASSAVWPALGLDAESHLLLVFNGEAWRAVGWGLEPERITDVLLEARSITGHYALKITGALDALAKARDKAGETPMSLVIGLSGGAVALVGLLAIVHRRRRLGHERDATALIDEAEGQFADLIIDVERLPESATELMSQADPLRRELDAAIRAVRSNPEDPVAVGRLRTAGNQIAALHSTVRQRQQSLK
ncbi:MAG: hypothetical protein ACE366_30055 [Bradymonadia bacterium]